MANPEFKPLGNICEFFNALHIYCDEARRGEVRTAMAHHYCSHISEDLRQCLVYDSAKKDASLIGVEYMIPRRVYETLDAKEQRLWHSHEYEVMSGMLVAPRPGDQTSGAWEEGEVQAMQKVVDLYGKTFHFWQKDRGDELPLGMPVLMGSLIAPGQADLDEEMRGRNEEFGVDHNDKARKRAHITLPGVHENADSWWKEAKAVGKQKG